MSHWVFAYGSNMHLDDLWSYLDQRQMPRGTLREVRVASIAGWRLVWNYRSKARNGGAANASRHDDSTLHGLALRVDDVLLAGIDRKEGHPGRYVRELVDASIASDGVTRRNVEAWLYVVARPFLSGDVVPPRSEYPQLMTDAAEHHGLPADYVAALRRTPTA